MKLQLIVTILGMNRPGILSAVAQCVAEANCNILDSRQAILGKDFSLTMIIEGRQACITKAEIMLPRLCQEHDLLSILKRTSEHCKQNLDHLLSLEFTGVDSLGIVKTVTSLFAEHGVSVSALRQQTFTQKQTGANMMRCKMMLSAPQATDINAFRIAVFRVLEDLGLTGELIDKQRQD
ncbi:glycine cleavage system protein R [Alteromonas oceanisediminis]|uniref:glycine cleavage system protein R n=1 Tax=Alteromonas oceanisediminis TaxID=2836180 RepID=UPI0020239D0D|nr:ACT domain-containing protein [Alteromonas oceanisediminis]